MALKRAIRTTQLTTTPKQMNPGAQAVLQQMNKGNAAGHNYANNGTGVPSYPGQQIGLTPAQAREMYGTQLRSKGYTFSGGTTVNKQEIDIPGDAKLLVGIATLNGAWGSVLLKVNSFEAIEDIDTGFTKIGDNKEFYRVELPLTGRDAIELQITGYAAYNNQPFIFFFI